MTNSLEVLRAPLTPLNLSDPHEFAQTEVHGIPLAVDREARARIAAAIGVAKEPAASAAAIPHLVEMMGQDRITAVSDAVVASFVGGSPTANDGRAAENMAHFGEADLACQVVASDALAAFGPAAVPALAEALKSPVANRRSGAAKALGKIGSAAADALPALKQLAKNDSAETVRKAADEAEKLIKPRGGWFS